MEDKNYYMTQGIGDSGIAVILNPAYLELGYKPFRVSPRNINVGQYFNTDSQYDESLGDVSGAIESGLTIDDLRAEKLSGWAMAGNALANNLVIAGTTAVGGTIGLVDGILEAALQLDISKLWDNPINNWVVDTQDAAREAMPIYRGLEYEDKSIWGKMGSGVFWADLVLNLGFTEGMLIPGAGMSRLIQSAPGIARAVIPSIVSSVGEASIEAVNSRNDEIGSKTEIATLRYQELVSLIDLPELLETLYNEYQLTLQDILLDATNAGNFVFGANIALLSMTNSIEFGSLFSRGFNTAKRLKGAIKRKGLGLDSSYSVNVGSHMAATTGKKVLDMFSEGMEEVSQSAISSTPSNYLDYNTFNESRFNPEKRELVSNLWSAFGQTYAETMRDPETLVEFASGFITGAIGVPTLRLSKVPIKVENNVIGELYDTYKLAQRLKTLAEEINRRLSDNSKIESYYNGIVRHLSLLDRMNTALDREDEYDYKSAESAQLISDIQMFDEAGDLDNLRNIVNLSIDTSDEGIDNLILETSKDGEGPFMLNGNPMDRELVREILDTRRQDILTKIDSYLEDKLSIESSYPNVDTPTVRNALFIRGQIRDHQQRFESLLSDSYNGVRSLLQGLVRVLPQENSENIKSILDNMTIDSFFIRYSSQPKFKEAIDELLNDDSYFPLDLRQAIKSKIQDMEILRNVLSKHNKNLTDILINPLKSALDELNTLNNIVQKLKARQSIEQIDKINNSSVSDIVLDIENAELDFDSFDDFFSGEEATDARDKVELARDIIDTDRRTRTDLEQLASTELIGEQELADALALLNNSKAVANSSEELLDLDTEAFNDPHALDDVYARETIAQTAEKEGWTLNQAQQEYNDVMSQRIDAAKNLISIVKSRQLEVNDELSEVPSPTPQLVLSTETVLTGHDSVDKNEPVNAPRQQLEASNTSIADKILSDIGLSTNSQLAKNIKDVLDYADIYIKRGIKGKELGDLLRSTISYGNAVQYGPRVMDALHKAINDKMSQEAPAASQLAQPRQVDTTPNISPEVIDTHIDTENLRGTSNQTTEAALETAQREGTSVDAGKVGGTYNYWRPSTTELPIHRERGNDTPYWLTVNSPARERYQAVYEYLKNNGAFSRVNNNQVKKGDEVHFGISKELSEKVGKPIILLLNSNNEVIGDLPMPKDASFNSYIGLPQLYAGASNWYKENHEYLHADGNDIAVIPGYKSNVARNMVGKPQYTSQDERHTLNQISTVTTSDGSQRQVPFRLGIAIANADSDRIRIMSDAGRSKSQGASPLERTIIAPLRAMKGLPFLLMPTSSDTRAFMPVPIMMPTFDMSNPSVANSTLGQEVSKKVLELTTIPNNTDLIMKWIDSIQELLSIPEIHVNFSAPEFTAEGRLPQELIVTIKRPGETKQTTIFKGPQEQAVDAVLNGLNGSMFQVSRKYINDTYDGRSYNEMIGELAETNLPIGATHTINDWFTIDPIVDRKQQKAHSPKSTRVNPTQTQGTVVRFQDASGNSYYLTSSNRLYKENLEGGDTELTDSKYNYLKAHAYGARINETFTRPYDTPWGYYNPLTGKFEVKPTEKPTDTVSASPSTLTTQGVESQVSREDSLASLKKMGLLNEKERNAALDKLSDDRLAKVAGMSKLKARLTLEKFDIKIKANMDSDAINDAFDSVVGSKPLNREVVEEMSKEKSWSREAEVKRMSKVLPLLGEDGRVRVVDGLIRIARSGDPAYAWGQFQNGIITLSDRAARGTMYHESFHFVTQTLLSQKELNDLYSSAEKQYGKLKRLELEEKLAEDFREFMQSYEDDGFFKNIFKTLKHIIKNLIGKETITNKLFHDIRRGALASRSVNTSNNTLYRKDPMTLTLELNNLRQLWRVSHSKKFQDEIKSFNGKVNRNWDAAYSIIDRYGLRDVAYVFEGQYGAAKIGVQNLKEFTNKADRLKAQIQDAYEAELSDYERLSNLALEELETYYREIEQYHREKLDYGRLNLEQKDYITERGLSLEEYNLMTPQEKEVLFRCMY